MSETTPLIKAALNLRVGVGFDVYVFSKDKDGKKVQNNTLENLNLLPSNVQSTDRGADAIRAVLGNLRAIPTKLAEIRNPFGSGHGKSASFQGLEIRHAKLAVGSSVTFVDFIWSSYESQNSSKNSGLDFITEY